MVVAYSCLILRCAIPVVRLNYKTLLAENCQNLKLAAIGLNV